MIFPKRLRWKWDYHIILICLFEIKLVCGRSVACLKGQIRQKLSGNESSRCCIPWPYNCPADYPYTVCNEEGGWDSCTKCPEDNIQPHMSNLTNLMKCYSNPPCQSEEFIGIKKPGSEEIHCVCDRRHDYKEIPFSCDKIARNLQCPEGEERKQDGSCGECISGTYKDWKGPGLCKPIANCERLGLPVKYPLSPDRDACVSSGITKLTSPSRGRPSVITSTSTTENIPNPSDPVDPVPAHEKPENTTPTWKIVGGCVGGALVVGIIVRFILWWRSRRSGRSRRNGSGGVSYSRTESTEMTNFNNSHRTPVNFSPLPPLPDGTDRSNGTVRSNGTDRSNRTVPPNGAVPPNGPDDSIYERIPDREDESNGTISQDVPQGSNGSNQVIQETDSPVSRHGNAGDTERPTAIVPPLNREVNDPCLVATGDEYSRVEEVDPLRLDSIPLSSDLSSGEQEAPNRDQLRPMLFNNGMGNGNVAGL